MAIKQIYQLPTAVTFDNDTLIPVQQYGTTKHVSGSQLNIVPVATILAMTSSSSANAVAVAASYTDAQIAAIDLSSYATKSLASDMSGAALQASKSYTDAASGNLQGQIATKADTSALASYALITLSSSMSANALAQANSGWVAADAVNLGFARAQSSAASGNALVQANSYSDSISGNLSVAISSKIDASELTPYALVTSVQTTAGNLQDQINSKASTVLAAAMSSNSYSQSIAYTNAVSASLSVAISLISGGAGVAGGPFLPISGGTLTGNIAISAANPNISLMHPGGFTSSMQTSGGKLIIKRDSSSNHIIIDGTGGYLNGTWFLGSGGSNIQIAGITDAWAAEANAKAYTDTASANIMSYAAGIGGVTPSYVQSASANAYVQSSAFTVAASSSIMTYVGQITANPPGNYVNLSTAQSISGIKSFNEAYIAVDNVRFGGNPTRIASGSIVISTVGDSTLPLTNATHDYHSIAIGAGSLYTNKNPTSCIAIGTDSQTATNNGRDNISIGTRSLASLQGPDTVWSGDVSNASYNIAIGSDSALGVVSGSRNIHIGYAAGHITGAPAWSWSRYDTLWIDSLKAQTSGAAYMFGDMAAGTLFIKGNRVATYTSAISGINMLDKPTIIAPRERVVALGPVSGAFNIDMSLGNFFTLTLTAGATATMTNPPANLTAQTVTVMVNQAGQGNNTLAFTGSKWAGGTAGTFTSGGLDMVNLVTYDAGGSFIATSLKDLR